MAADTRPFRRKEEILKATGIGGRYQDLGKLGRKWKTWRTSIVKNKILLL